MLILRCVVAVFRWLRNLIPAEEVRVTAESPMWSMTTQIPPGGVDIEAEVSQLRELGFYQVGCEEPGVRKYVHGTYPHSVITIHQDEDQRYAAG